LLVSFFTLVLSHAVHKLQVGSAAIAVVPHQVPQAQSTINLVVHVALVAQPLSQPQVQVQGQLHSTVLAVVPLAQRLVVGFVFELVLLEVQQAQSTINLVVHVALFAQPLSQPQVQVQGQLHSMSLAVVPLAHKLVVGFVFELVLLEVPQAPFTINSQLLLVIFHA
jgi:uncharacterized membrane protein (Fun14 family)